MDTSEKRNSTTITAVSAALTILFFIVLFPAAALSFQEKSSWLDNSVTIEFDNLPMKTVLERIGKQAGVSILYDQSLANEKVMGKLHNVKVSDAIDRLFKGRNKIIQVDDAEKIIVVKTFGTKNFIWAGPEHKTSPITLAELDEMHALQYQQYKNSLTDENRIYDDGITMGELNAMHAQQYAEYKARHENDDEIVLDGVTRGELNALHRKQYEAYKAGSSNEDEIILDGITRAELDKMHKQQQREYSNSSLDSNAIIPGLGISRGQLDEIHKQQYEAYKKDAENKSKIISF